MQRTQSWREYAPLVPFRLGVVTNEIDDEVERAVEIAADLGIEDVEINTVWRREVTDLSDDEVRRVRDLVLAQGLRVHTVLGPAFKALPLSAVTAPGEGETAEYRRHREALERAFEVAHLLGTQRVRVFAFRRPLADIGAGTPGWRASPPPTEADLYTIVRGLRPLCVLAEREGITLMLENVRYSYADTGAHARSVLDAVASPNLRLIWDPSNAYVSGDARPYPDGYAAVQSYVGHVHLKDARFTDAATGATEWLRIGDGAVDLLGQLRALVADGYSDAVSLETHWRLPGDLTGERSTIETWNGLRSLLDDILRAHTHRGADGRERARATTQGERREVGV